MDSAADILRELDRVRAEFAKLRAEMDRVNNRLENLQGSNGIDVNGSIISFDPRSLRLNSEASSGTRYEFEVNDDGVQVTYVWNATLVG